MSYADKVFIENCKDIIENGFWDLNQPVRPRWEDGTPAHTVKKFCIVNRYDLSKEFPILTIRKTFFKSAIDEILWIWQKKSNNVKDLNSHIKSLIERKIISKPKDFKKGFSKTNETPFGKSAIT